MPGSARSAARTSRSPCATGTGCRSRTRTSSSPSAATGSGSAATASTPFRSRTANCRPRLPSPPGPLLARWLDLFNAATLPFYWGRFEPQRGHPDTERLRKAAAWFVERGCRVKGHPLCWHTITADWLLDLPGRRDRGGAARPDPPRRGGLRRPDRQLGRDQRGRDHAHLRQVRQRDQSDVPAARPDRDRSGDVRCRAGSQPEGDPAAQRLRRVRGVRGADRALPRGRDRDRRPGHPVPHAPGLVGRGEDPRRPRAASGDLGCRSTSRRPRSSPGT